jgi:Carboxypeptidase regulatory-like domain
MKYSYAVAFFALSLARAQECSLKGVAVSDAGSPVAGLQVSIGSISYFHAGQGRTMKTGEDGSFSFTGLPCGKYTLTALTSDIGSEFPGILTVDIKKQPVIQLKIPNVDPLASLLYVAPEKEPQPIPVTPNRPAPGSASSEDPAISLQRRAYFAQLNPAQLAAYDTAPLADKKRMYIMAVTARMMGILGGDPAAAAQQPESAQRRRSVLGKLGRMSGVHGIEVAPQPTPHAEEDQMARRRLTQAVAIVRENLPQEDTAGFARAPEIERARVFLRAVAVLPVQHGPGCGMYGLMLTDMEGGGGTSMGPMLNRFLDDPTAARWEDLDTRGRCALIDRTAVKELEMAKDLESDGSIDSIKSVLARTGASRSGPRWMVLEAFGNEGLEHYERARSVDQKLEVFRAALLMQLCWGVAYTAM